MRPSMILMTIGFALLAGGGEEGAAQSGSLHSPYLQRPQGEIRSLTPREIQDLETGAGMGMALPAELNGYPGPRHVLDADAAGRLPLTPAQRAAVSRIFAAMKSDAERLGREVLQLEGDLELRFRHGHIDEAALRDLLRRANEARTELRFVHLRAHLATRALLTPAQLAAYQKVRGYTPPAEHHGETKH